VTATCRRAEEAAWDYRLAGHACYLYHGFCASCLTTFPLCPAPLALPFCNIHILPSMPCSHTHCTAILYLCLPTFCISTLGYILLPTFCSVEGQKAWRQPLCNTASACISSAPRASPAVVSLFPPPPSAASPTDHGGAYAYLYCLHTMPGVCSYALCQLYQHGAYRRLSASLAAVQQQHGAIMEPSMRNNIISSSVRAIAAVWRRHACTQRTESTGANMALCVIPSACRAAS